MAAIVSSNFRTLNAQNFKEDVTAVGSNVYIGLGKPSAWSTTLTGTVEASPTTPSDTIDVINQARANLLGLKLIGDSDISHVVPRYNWVAQETFVAWDSNDADIYEKAFYCLTPDFKVYKCLYSPGTGVSDVPTNIGVDPFETADNYIWKYMYTVIASDSEKFLTTSYMPVKTLTVSTTAKASATAQSVGNTVAGTIELLAENPAITVGQRVSAAELASGAFANTTTVTAVSGKFVSFTATTAYGTDEDTVFTFGDFVDTNVLYPQQQVQKSSASNSNAGGIERIVIGKDLQGNATFGTGYTSQPTITIEGDGTNAAFAGQNVTITSGALASASYYVRAGSGNAGTGYTVADVTISGGGASEQAKARAVITPGAGHGTDPVTELGAFYIAINSQISGATDSIDIVNTQDFRQITLIKNPLDSSGAKFPTTNTTLSGTPFLHCTDASSAGMDTLNTAALTGDPIITAANGAKAYVVAVDTDNEYIYYHQNANTGYKAFVQNETITAQVGAVSLTLAGTITLESNSNTFLNPAEFDTGTGEILFLENRDAIQRSSSQIEDVKLIIEF